MAQVSAVFTSSEITCMHCSVTITGGLSSTQGIQQVFVDVAAKTIAVDYDPDVISEAKIVEKIAELGYAVSG